VLPSALTAAARNSQCFAVGGYALRCRFYDECLCAVI
jgi:hypothetical protein